MTDYKRFISYMYMYKKGIKGVNVGFAKIEARNNNCKFIINIKSNLLKDKKWKIVVFHRGEDIDNNTKIYPIDVDELEISKDEFNNTYITKVDNLFESNIGLSKIVGIILVNDINEYIGTEWDDNGIEYGELKLLFNGELNKINNTDVIDEVEQIDKSENKEDFIIEENNTKKEDRKDTLIKKSNIENNIKNSIDKNQVVLEDETEIKKEIKEDQKPYIKRIFNGFPGMYPFEDDEIMDCVKLEPHDIGIFPMDKWSLANNSFLLHGYYTYRHLIFARMKHKEKINYILGVPGIFRDRERFMARMFGFNNFKGVRNKPLDVGEFGYWYMYFNL